jgi:TerC family integral membrane protein
VKGDSAPSVSGRSPIVRVIAWIGLGLAVGVWFAATQGATAAAEYYAAYFLEESLSLDNIFVFAIVFSELQIPEQYQRRVLRYGILGALVFRAAAIGGGIALITRFTWAMYPFAILILLAAWRLAFAEERERRVVEGACNVCESWITRVIPVSPVIHGPDFWRREGNRVVATPLLVALVVIETSDIVFALDSVPAVLSVSQNPYIVYSSNVMAMLGLRSLFFVVSDVLGRLPLFRYGLATILAFTGVKMLAADVIHISAGASVLMIGAVVLATALASAVARRAPKRGTA